MDEENIKVDVPLKWLDFLWSLEQLRHKKQYTTEQNRDWFKLNPLELVLLGCETITKNQHVTSKLSTIVVSMENITPYCLSRPRILRWLLDFLLKFVSTDGVSSFLLQRVRKLLVAMCHCSESFRFYYWINTFVVEICEEEPTKKMALCSFDEGKVFVDHIYDALRTVDMDEDIRTLCFSLNSTCLLKLNMLINEYSFVLVQALWDVFNINEITQMLNEASSDVVSCTNEFLLLVELIINAYDKCESTLKEEVRDDLYRKISVTREDSLNDSNIPLKENVIAEISSSFMLFFKDVRNFLKKCTTLFDGPTKVPQAFFAYVNAELSFVHQLESRTLSDLQLYILMEFFLDYSTKGVKGKVSENIMCCLLELITSSSELEIPRSIMLTVHLPNLLSIGFNNMTEDIVCLLLQYGSLACRSKFKTDLLSKGLWFLKALHELFKSPEEKMRENDQIALRIESLTIVNQILQDLIDSGIVSEQGSDESAIAAEKAQYDTERAGIPEQDCDQLKVNLIKLLLKLACDVIKFGENFIYIYASVLPRLFCRTDFPVVPDGLSLSCFPSCVSKRSTLPWRIGKEKLAVEVLELCIDCLQAGICGPFQICSVMIPKLVKNLDFTELKDIIKMDILLEFLRICHKKLLTNEHIETLISHGIDVMSLLMPKNDNEAEVKTFIREMTTSLEKFGNSSSMLLLKTSCQFMVTNFEAEHGEVKALFTFLIKKYNRNDIRNVFMLSKPWFTHHQYQLFRKALYQFSVGKFKSKQLHAMADILTSTRSVQDKVMASMDIETPAESNVVVDHILKEMAESIHNNCFNVEKQESIKIRVSRLSLYHVLFADKMQALIQRQVIDNVDWMGDIESEIPEDILSDSVFMNTLQICARRIEQMQTPRYQCLEAFLVNLLQEFIMTDSDNIQGNQDAGMNFLGKELDESKNGIEDEQFAGGKAVEERRLNQRITVLDHKLMMLPWNASKREKLISLGYNNSLWSDKLEVAVKTSGHLNLEENLRLTLLSCFTEYCELLRQLGISDVSVDGQQVKVEDIFTDEYALTELKGRRAIVVKLIDKHASVYQQTRILERKSALLVQEETIERKIEKTAQLPFKPHSYTAKLNISFFDCANCCGSQIVGCYSPMSGEHCERPLEIGFRADSAFGSIYNEDGLEIENCEMLFTDQGAYIYKAYSSGHPYDTSEVWTAFFIELLESKEFFPAIILPHHFPNRSTWEAFRRWVSPDITGTVLTCDFDFSSEWRSYYDSRPECVGYGKDIILTKGFQSRERRTSFSYRRQLSLNTNKDFAGMLFDFVMEAILEKDDLKSYRFLGKHFALYLNELVSTGASHPNVISDHFDYERWKKGKKYGVKKTKEEILELLISFILYNVALFISDADLDVLFNTRLRQFLQLRAFLEKNCSNQDVFPYSQPTLEITKRIMKSHLRLVEIGILSEAFQEELMHWIFDNEDRVWRYRGGRDGHETLTQYLEFLSHKQPRKKCYPGVVWCLQRGQYYEFDNVQVKDVVAYAVGEYVASTEPNAGNDEKEKSDINGSYYEIVTAWVDPRFRGLQLSTSLYTKIFQSVTSSYIYFDMLSNSAIKVMETFPLFKLLHDIGLMKFFIVDQALSYDVDTVTRTEQFEKFVIKRRPTATCISMLEFFQKKFYFLIGLFILLFAIFAAYYF